MKEIWKDIKGYKGLYQVSNLGNVKSLERNIPFTNRWGQRITRLQKEHLFKQSANKYGYSCVYIKKNKKMYFVHRLVYEAFYGKIPFWMQVNHINEIKSDNRLENLNLLTPKANSNWGTRNKRVSIANSKPVLQYDLEGNFIKEWPSATEVEKVLGYKQQTISKCCTSKKYFKTAYRYIWKFKKFTT